MRKNVELVDGIDGKGKRLQSRIWFFSLRNDTNDIEQIEKRLADCSASLVFAITHDKDRKKIDDGTTVPKEPHTHYALRWENPTQLQTVANIFGLGVEDYNLIQKCKNFKASCRYMLHLDSKDKYTYDIRDLRIIKGTKDDFYNIAIGKAQFVTTDADLFPDFGNFDKVPYKQQYQDIYRNVDENKRRNLLLKELDISWKNYLQVRVFEMEKKKVNVMFIEGLPGSGKSTFAKNLAVTAKKSFCVSSSSNDIMQDYTCEDFLILDDLRESAFSFEDLLKLLDNYVISTVKSRYKNKLFLGEQIIITSSKPLHEWYKGSKEDRRQLFRRINMFTKCRKEGNELVADCFIPFEGQPIIDDNGFPQGRSFPCPIITITPSFVQATEEAWRSLGLAEYMGDLDSSADRLASIVKDNLKGGENV